ncbi:MAG TPA: DNA-directed RNA polymerase subunit alpha [Bacillota bacterium]|nr:DNA-directed RNA polymerase subunit alpha [Bacillota bacterium]HPF42018.1 DNA-directed RNA polymerase subunit alpha [Bacillota bacterium]HPJ85908.1 DNA-directed RNA polymerase subunit alpha [Bacillota bacterium]HPQ61802.1 DNA-directed RNA polymerase subunit alpha [Bacillota bacterium]HRX91221.1 DNA-directed RNA polymerase subunit alpha [Candidatus Izemoplasmatales bacterium]
MKELKFEKPKTTIEEINDTYGRFVVTPLDRGFGITIGNSLRRVLLSSLPGAAIINVQIEGVQHEFTAIENVTEDVTTIILNLKGVVLTIDSSNPNVEKRMEVIVDGPTDVFAKDIIADDEVAVINPDHYICHVNKGARFRMVLHARKGNGYISADKNAVYDNMVGVIPIDSLYTPVVKANYIVDKTRVDDSADHDKLTVEVWTNGSISPKEAIGMAAKMLIDHFYSLVELSSKAMSEDFMIERKSEEASRNLEKPIEDLDLSVRSYNCLKRAGIHTLGELVEKTEEDMMKVRNLGKKSLKEVKQKLEELNLSLAKH